MKKAFLRHFVKFTRKHHLCQGLFEKKDLFITDDELGTKYA